MALTKSFYNVLLALKACLEADADVAAFIAERYDRPLTVTLSFRPRPEIQLKDLPLIMVTAPSYQNEDKPGMRGRESRRVMLYMLVHQTDRVKGLEEICKLEELVDQALQKNGGLGGLCTDIRTGVGAATDEGMYHPVYSVVKATEIIRHINQTAR